MILVYNVEENVKHILSKMKTNELDLSILNSPNLSKLLHWYWKIFDHYLPKNLSIKQNFYYSIEIDDVLPINIDLYL